MPHFLEIAIKLSLNKIKLPIRLNEFVKDVKSN